MAIGIGIATGCEVLWFSSPIATSMAMRWRAGVGRLLGGGLVQPVHQGGGGAGLVAQEAGAARDVAEAAADAAGDLPLGDAFAQEAEDGPSLPEGGQFGAGEEVGEHAAHFGGIVDGAQGLEEMGFVGFHGVVQGCGCTVGRVWCSNCMW